MCVNLYKFVQVKGIKGASVFFLHSPFDVVKGVAIDSLHIIFLGVVSDLLKFWFDKVNRSSSYSIYTKVKGHALIGSLIPRFLDLFNAH